MHEIPVASRSQRRSERRQILVMGVLVVAIAGASFLLGVMVGERNSARQVELAYQTSMQIAAPPLPGATAAAPSRLTFYEDLPRGNAAPLGSGINLPKGGYVAPPPPPPAAAAAPAAAPTAPPAAQAAVAKAPAPAPAPAAPKASSGGSVVVQVAATKDQAEAKRLVDKLKGKGFAAYSERADLGAKGVWYRVMTGPYADRAAADKVAAQLKQQKFSAIVRAR